MHLLAISLYLIPFFSELKLAAKYIFENIYLQTLHRKQLKPPILVVPFDTSGLLCFIRREDREDENLSDEVTLKNSPS